MLEELRRRGIEGLRMSHFAVLRNVDLGGSKLTEIARRAGQSKQAIGPLVHELVSLGVLTLEADPQDGRAWKVRFTPAGERGLRDAREGYGRLLGRYVDTLGERPMRELIARLASFVESAERTADAAERALRE